MSKIQDIKSRFGIVGNHPSLINAIEIAMKVAPTDITTLILGESGVGKENISKIIHSLSRRKHNGFIAINCGAIPAGTIDSELFGHEKGSFTSAVEARKGYFETVDGGTIFLDEIGELPLETQSRLLRVLESGEFLKVGSSKVQKTNVRVIAATNRDLLAYSQEGKFREDLYYRLSTVSIKIPPLRERLSDIPLLVAKFAGDIADKYHIPPVEISREGIQEIQQFPWPGNVRQLKNFIEQISILETDREVNSEIIRKYLPDLPAARNSSSFQAPQVPVPPRREAEDYGNEREILYRYLSDMKNQLNEIHGLMLGLAGAAGMTVPAYGGFHGSPTAAFPAPIMNPAAPRHHAGDTVILKPGAQIVHDVEQETEKHEPMSLQEHEKEMIRLSLARHKGKRKAAADELGISERTLYRKIKEYGLED